MGYQPKNHQKFSEDIHVEYRDDYRWHANLEFEHGGMSLQGVTAWTRARAIRKARKLRDRLNREYAKRVASREVVR